MIQDTGQILLFISGYLRFGLGLLLSLLNDLLFVLDFERFLLDLLLMML